MLLELTIHNLAVIRETRLSFAPGLNVLTGETGAGKSMVIDALGAVLGARTSAEVVRTGAPGAWVEAVFDIAAIQRHEELVAELAEIGIIHEIDEPLILSRDISAAGRSTARISNRTVTVATLARVGQLLVDIHGQSDHLSLLRPHVQLELLDRYAGTIEQRQSLAESLDAWRQLRARIQDFDDEQRQRAQRIDLLQYQSDEIEAAAILPDEDELLAQERARLANAERLMQMSAEAVAALNGDATSAEPTGALDLLRIAGRILGDIANLDAGVEPTLTRLNEALFVLEDVSADVRDYAEQIEIDPQRLELVEERLDLLRRLKRKYGPTLEDVNTHAESIASELAQLTAGEDDIDALREAEARQRNALGTAADQLSETRKAAALKLAAKVEEAIHELNMGRASFEVRFETQSDPDGVAGPDGEPVAIDSTGIDQITFYLATNRGEDPRPLARIASGGETARLMLALKSILSDADETPVLIFDEVDVGVGGRSGQVVGEKLWDLTGHHQAIVISHLPQIAAFADHHITLVKTEEDDRTVTTAQIIDGIERVDEIAAMLDGTPITPESRASATSLLKRAETWKTGRSARRKQGD